MTHKNPSPPASPKISTSPCSFIRINSADYKPDNSISVSENNDNSIQPSFIEQIKFTISFYTLTALLHHKEARPHWDTIVDGLILSALPIATQINGHGDHGHKFIEECNNQKRPLAAVFSLVKNFELEGKGLNLQPVQPQFWQDNNIKHYHIPMQDFTGNINLELFNQLVDDIHKYIENNKSVIVHCKAGRGRSFALVMCYLLKHTEMNVTEALALVYQKRPQVSPSQPQFDLIERYRTVYCSNKEPLDTDSESYAPFRKDIPSYFKNFLGFIGSFVLPTVASPFKSFFESILQQFSSNTKLIKNTEKKYESPQQTEAIWQLVSNLSNSQVKALMLGIEVSKEPTASILNTEGSNILFNYNHYRYGLDIAKNNPNFSKLLYNELKKRHCQPESIELDDFKNDKSKQNKSNNLN